MHWCVTVDYQQIANDNIANQIHGFTIDYGKFILNFTISGRDNIVCYTKDLYTSLLNRRCIVSDYLNLFSSTNCIDAYQWNLLHKNKMSMWGIFIVYLLLWIDNPYKIILLSLCTTIHRVQLIDSVAQERSRNFLMCAASKDKHNHVIK